MPHAKRFDAPFWGALLLGTFLVTALGFFGLAAAAQDLAEARLQPIEHDDTVY